MVQFPARLPTGLSLSLLSLTRTLATRSGLLVDGSQEFIGQGLATMSAMAVVPCSMTCGRDREQNAGSGVRPQVRRRRRAEAGHPARARPGRRYRVERITIVVRRFALDGSVRPRMTSTLR